jgi:hypothetical protein
VSHSYYKELRQVVIAALNNLQRLKVIEYGADRTQSALENQT